MTVCSRSCSAGSPITDADTEPAEFLLPVPFPYPGESASDLVDEDPGDRDGHQFEVQDHGRQHAVTLDITHQL